MREKFLQQLHSNAYILDFGCGSGRDSKYFIEKGYRVKAIDGSIEMCKLASKYIKHVEKENLSGILNKMINALKVNGIIYTSFKKENS